MAGASREQLFRVLSFVAGLRRPVGVSEVTRALELPLSTTHRLLSTLEKAGYVERYQASTSFVTGPQARQLAHSFFSRFGLREACLPYLRQIAFACGETTSLVVPVGWHCIRIATVTGTKDVVSSHALGDPRLLDQTPGGRSILANLPPERLEAFIAWRSTHASPGAPPPGFRELRSNLRLIRAAGYATGETPFSPGRAEIAMAVCRANQPIAAICIEGPVIYASPRAHDLASIARWQDITSSLSQLANEQSEQLADHYAHLGPEGPSRSSPTPTRLT